MFARVRETKTCGDLVWITANEHEFHAYAGGGLLDVPYRVRAAVEPSPEGSAISGDVAPSGQLLVVLLLLSSVLAGVAWLWIGVDPARWLPLVALLAIVGFAWRRSSRHLDGARMDSITHSVRVLVKPDTPNRSQRKRAKRAARGKKVNPSRK